MQNIVIGSGSESGKREIGRGDIGTTRGNISVQGGYGLNEGVNLQNEDSIAIGVKNLVSSFNTVLLEGVNISMHAMDMNKKNMSREYPEQVVNEFLELIGTLDKSIENEVLENGYILNALLISFHDEYSENNTNGSHVFYGAREAKKEIEGSLLNSQATNKKIVDLEVFDSPSSKVLGLTFLGVVGQFIEYVESDNNKIGETGKLNFNFKEGLKTFLGEDYSKIITLFNKYPLSGELKEGQESMMKLGEEKKLNPVMNQAASDINFAKLSYISGILSELYLTFSMKYLKENKDEVFESNGDRILLDWETILGKYTSNPFYGSFGDNDNLNNLLKEFEDKLRKVDLVLDKDKETNLLFKEQAKTENTREYKFYPSDQNFEKIGKHFGITPLMITNGVIYNSGLLKEDEYIKETAASSKMYTGNTFVLERTDNVIKVYNKSKPGEIFATLKIISNDNEIKELSKGGIISKNEYKEFDATKVPHGKDWFNVFGPKKINKTVFGLEIDPKATILEYVGVQIAQQFFINPSESDLNELKEYFPKAPDFSTFQGMFGKVGSDFNPNFNKKIKEDDFNFKITKLKGRASVFVNIDVEVFNNNNELLSSHTFLVV